MGITPIELKEYKIRVNKLGGNNRDDVEAFKELSVEALTETQKDFNKLKEKYKGAIIKLREHEKREAVLKDTITTAQKMVDTLKNNAMKEAELIIVDARHKAEQINGQAQKRAAEILNEIQGLKRQRLEFESSLKALLEYHQSLLDIEKKEAGYKDRQVEKIKIFPK